MESTFFSKRGSEAESHNSSERFPNPSLAVPNRHFFMPHKLFPHVTGFLLNFLTKTGFPTRRLQTWHFHTRQRSIREQSRTQRRKALERRITSFDLHHQRIRLPNSKNRNERKGQRERHDKTNARVGSCQWLLQRSN